MSSNAKPAPPRRAAGLRRWAAGLLNQQLWCWGRDIARPEGNLLLELGMCRSRAADPRKGSTLYTATDEDGGCVGLWGFGVFYAEPAHGGLFLKRYDFAPLLTDRLSPAGAFDLAGLGALRPPRAAGDWGAVRALIEPLAGWVARYEHWVAETLGVAYRDASLRGLPQAAAAAARDMASSWEQVARKCRRLRSLDRPARGPWAGLLGRLQAGLLAEPAPGEHRRRWRQ